MSNRGKAIPVLTVLAVIIAIWYACAVWMNAPFEYDRAERANAGPPAFSVLVSNTMAQERPVLPAPHQVFSEIYKTTVQKKITSKRSLVYHAWITLSATLLGFLIGTAFGIALAVGIVHNRAMDKSVMPWVITSQTIPILAIAPMIIVVLNAVGLSGLLPKALISTYLSFFPVVVGMVKGLRAPDRAQLDLMHTYSASRAQTWKRSVRSSWSVRLSSKQTMSPTSKSSCAGCRSSPQASAATPTTATTAGPRLIYATWAKNERWCWSTASASYRSTIRATSTYR